MKPVRLLIAAFTLSLLSLARPALADETLSVEGARLRQALQMPVGADPVARLYVAEGIAALGQPEQAATLRAVLVGLQLRVADGEAVDPALSVGGLLSQSTDPAPLGADSTLAKAWSGAVAHHVRLRFLDAAGAAAHPLPEADRGGRSEVAPGLWVTNAPVGSMVLFVQAHQEPAARLVLTRLRVQWLGTHLNCAPAQGLAAREQDAVFACDGTSRAAELAPRVRAATASPGGELAAVVDPGEFDSPTATSAWIDAMAAGHEAELKQLLARAAPCEAASAPAQRCQWAAPAAPAVAADVDAPPPAPSRSSWSLPGHLESRDVATMISWFCAGAVLCWLVCSVLASRSILIDFVLHVLVTCGLSTAAWWIGVVAWMVFSNAHRGSELESALLGLGTYALVLLGIVAGGLAHFVRRIFELVQDGPVWLV